MSISINELKATIIDLRSQLRASNERAEAAEEKLRDNIEYYELQLARFGNPYIHSVVFRRPDFDEVLQIIDARPTPVGLRVLVTGMAEEKRKPK